MCIDRDICNDRTEKGECNCDFCIHVAEKYELDKNGSTTLFNLGIRQKVTDQFGLYAEYTREDSDNDGFGVGLTMSF